MMTRARRIFAAAAAILAGGGVLYATALRDANLADLNPLTCAELRELARVEVTERVSFFVAFAQGYAPPSFVGDRLLGECTAGQCVVVPANGCGVEVAYPFRASPAVQGWRLAEVHGHPYVAGSWKALSAAAPEVLFWGSRKDVATACLTRLTAGQCAQLLASVQDCWRKPDGTWCRHGLLYGPGIGGVDADGNPVTCAPAVGDEWYSCDDGGTGLVDYAEVQRTYDLPPDEDLDL